MRARSKLALAGGLLLTAMGLWACRGDIHECPAVPSTRLAEAPQHLSETSLWSDPASFTVAPDVMAYSPQFELWSDGAQKRRWIRLPAQSQIDSSDMDFWQFPVGTRIWKEFSYGGKRIETRLLQKIGPGAADWLTVSYAWNEAQADATLAAQGVENALGSGHAIPAADQCWGCHGGVPSHVLGFSAIQLAHAPEPGEIALDDLIHQGRLTAAPAAVPVVPGNETERAALGYLHANCAHCHNQSRPEVDGPRCYDPKRSFDMLLRVGQLASPSATATYRTTIGKIVEPGKPDDSAMIQKASKTSAQGGMPPLAKAAVDEHGVALLRAWISELPRD